jgi:hypothetical protein
MNAKKKRSLVDFENFETKDEGSSNNLTESITSSDTEQLINKNEQEQLNSNIQTVKDKEIIEENIINKTNNLTITENINIKSNELITQDKHLSETAIETQLFNQNHDNKQKEEEYNINNKLNQLSEKQNIIIDNIKSKEVVLSNTDKNNVTVNSMRKKSSNTSATNGGAGSQQNFIAMFDEQRKQKKTVEETHTRQTYLIRNDLIDRLESIAYNKDRGFKTAFLNHAIERLLNEVDN